MWPLAFFSIFRCHCFCWCSRASAAAADAATPAESATVTDAAAVATANAAAAEAEDGADAAAETAAEAYSQYLQGAGIRTRDYATADIVLPKSYAHLLRAIFTSISYTNPYELH